MGDATAAGKSVRAGAGVAPGAGAASSAGKSTCAGVGAAVGIGPAMASGAVLGFYLPNAVLATDNLQDTSLVAPPVDLTDVQDDPEAADGDWWTAVNPTADVEARLGSQTPGGTLVTAQAFQVLVRKTGWHGHSDA